MHCPPKAGSLAALCSLKALSVRSWVHTKCVWGLPASLAARAAASASSVMGMALAEPAGVGSGSAWWEAAASLDLETAKRGCPLQLGQLVSLRWNSGRWC